MSEIGRASRWAVAALALLGLAVPAADLATVPVLRAALPQVFRLDGIAEATARSTVSAQTSGRVVEVHFDVDDYVRQGDVIVVLEDRQQRAGVAQAQAKLKAASARRQEADDELRRIQGVFAKGAVAQAALDKASAAAQEARAGEQAAQAALRQAEQELEYTRIRAPYNGIVTERLIEVGETAQPGRQLMSGLSLDRMRIAVDVPQNLIGSIRAERKAQAKIDDRWVAAEQVTVFPVADPRSDTFKVRLELPEGLDGVFPGMYIKVGIITGTQTGLVVPLSAIVWRSEVVGLYVVDAAGRVQFRHVRLGSPAGADHVALLSGADEGELVATDPVAAGILLKAQRSPRVVDD